MYLKRGMKSPDVATVQRILAALGFDIDPDGDFGPQTEKIVTVFQQLTGLEEDGIVGSKTLAELDEQYQPDVMNFTSSNRVPSEETIHLTDGHPRLKGVHPSVASRAVRMIGMAEEEGYIIRVSQGLRTFAQQAALFERRPRVTRAPAGRSWHQYGMAVDFAWYGRDNVLDWDPANFENIGLWAGRVGLEWGGNWRTFKDRPHCQAPGLGSTREALRIYNANGKGDSGIRAVWRRFGQF